MTILIGTNDHCHMMKTTMSDGSIILKFPFVRVVIVAFDGVEMTLECIKSVLESGWPQENQEIVLVDNGSLDNVVNRTKELFPQVKILEPLRNLGFAGGCNLGIQASTSSDGSSLHKFDYVALVNNDATVSKGWLTPLVQELESSQFLGAVSPKMVFAPQFVEVEVSGFFPDAPSHQNEPVCVSGVRVDGERKDHLLVFDEGFGGPDPESESYGDDFARWTPRGGRVRVVVSDELTDGVHTVSLRIGARNPGWVKIRTEVEEKTVRVGSREIGDPDNSKWTEIQLGNAPFDVINNVGSELYIGGSAGDRGIFEQDRGQYDQSCEVFAWCGGAVLLRKKYLDEVGLFDESFFLYYEDTDLSWRGRLQGWEYRYVPQSVVRHHHAQSSGVGSDLFRFQVERNRLLVLAKNAPLKLVLQSSLGEMRRFVRAIASDILRPVVLIRRPVRANVGFRYRVIRSYLGLLPKAFGNRWIMDRRVSRKTIMAWAVKKSIPVPAFDDVLFADRNRDLANDPSSNARPRAAVYNLYWNTLGGGEVVGAEFARVLLSQFDVTLLGPEQIDKRQFNERLGVDLTGCEWSQVANDDEASFASGDFDVFVNCTYLSSAVNASPVGLYYVHFPGNLQSEGFKRRLRISLRMARLFVHVPIISRKVKRLIEVLNSKIIDTTWTHSYSRFLANSEYTQKWIQAIWGAQSEVVYPPVTTSVNPGLKTTSIASVGRFFDPRFGHSKKQLELVSAFDAMAHSGDGVGSWRLNLVGGADGANRDYVMDLRRAAKNQPIEVHVNASKGLLDSVLSQASIYWHAGGFQEDENVNPERFEHFGISIVEAMAAGAVPVVFGVAGPSEIVRHGVDGFHWKTLEELVAYTRQLMSDSGLLTSMAQNAKLRAEDFAVSQFASKIKTMIDECPVRS